MSLHGRKCHPGESKWGDGSSPHHTDAPNEQANGGGTAVAESE